MKVLDAFDSAHSKNMRRWPLRLFLLLIDFDSDTDRLVVARRRIPMDLHQRTFILGAFSDPEQLRSQIGKTLDEIGQDLAKDCKDQTNRTWGHPLLLHNAAELARLQGAVRTILFHGP